MRVDVFAAVFAAFVGHELLPSSAWGQESQVDGLRTAQASRANGSDGLALGRALRRAGRNKEALIALRAAIPGSPGPRVTAALYGEIAHVYVDTRDFAQSMAACKRVGDVPGSVADGHVCAAEAQFIRQRASEALIEIAAALKIDPRSFGAKYAEGRAYELELDTTKAEASLREAIDIDANEAQAHVALGRVLLKQDRRGEAVTELRKGVAIDPLGPDALFELAKALGAGSESMALLARAVRERPVFSEAWLALGVQELGVGRLAEAGQAAASAARIDPSDTRARVLLGQVALAEGRPDEAIRDGHAVLKVVANDAAAQLLVGDGNAKKGEVDLALEAYQAAWGLDHSNPASLVSASAACHAAGRDTSARAFAVRATQEFPAWGPAWVVLGDALVGQNEKLAARGAYQQALATTAGPIDRDSLQRKLAAR